jgi:hypothetical protein
MDYKYPQDITCPPLQEMVLYMTFFVDVLKNHHEIILYALVIVRMIQL